MKVLVVAAGSVVVCRTVVVEALLLVPCRQLSVVEVALVRWLLVEPEVDHRLAPDLVLAARMLWQLLAGQLVERILAAAVVVHMQECWAVLVADHRPQSVDQVAGPEVVVTGGHMQLLLVALLQ